MVIKHGAPDWTVRTELGLIGYVDKHVLTILTTINAGLDHTFVDETGVGCVGGTAFQTSHFNMVLYVAIDGVTVFSMTPWYCYNYHGLGSCFGMGLFGCSQYDTINDRYSFWYNPNYQMVFYKSFKIWIHNSTGVNHTVQNFNSYWKIRE